MALPDHNADHSQIFSFSTPLVDAHLVDPGSLTYEPYFGLREKPFSLSPDPRFFFSHPARRATFDALVAGIRRREGILVLTGEVGTGKTTLCRAVLKALDGKTFAAFVPDPFLSREDLLKTLLVDFGVVSIDEIRSGRLQGASRTDLSYPLYEFLASLQDLHAFAVVIIDEAQNLPPQLLEEIRILADMEDRQKLIQVLLVGQPELDASFASHEMRQLRQRLSLQCELLPLERADLGPYISHRLTVAGSNNTIRFIDTAVDRIFAVSGGIPRIVNLVCDRALARAAEDQTGLITTDHVASAIRVLRLQDTQPITVQPVTVQPVTVQPVIAPVTVQPMAAQPVAVPAIAPLADLDEPEMLNDGDSSEPREANVNLESLDDIWAAKVQEYYVPEGRSGLEIYEPESSFSLPGFIASARKVLAVAAGASLVLILAGWAYSRWGAAPPRREVKASVPSAPVVLHAEPMPAAPPLEAAAQESPSSTPPVSAAVETPVATQAHGAFAILMATLETPAGAERAVRELNSLSYSAYSRRVSLSSGQSAYAVFLGPYDEMTTAQRDLEQAQKVRGYTGGRVVSVGPAPLP